MGRDACPVPVFRATCCGCGRYLHVTCVTEAGTIIAWHHLWFSNMRMRAFIEEHRLMGQEVALCSKCHGELSDQIVANYKAMEQFAEGARFLEEFGWAEEDARSSRVTTRPTSCWPISRGSSGALRDYLGEPGSPLRSRFS